jgi:hypothetical protein
MSIRKSVSLNIAITCLAISPMIECRAQPLDKAALDAITDTADRICNTINTQGSSSNLTAQGEITAQVSQLLKQLANIGVSGTGAYTASSYVGVLQKDLPQMVADSAKCKLTVSQKLVDLTTTSRAPQAATDISALWPTNTGAYPIDEIDKNLNKLQGNSFRRTTFFNPLWAFYYVARV